MGFRDRRRDEQTRPPRRVAPGPGAQGTLQQPDKCGKKKVPIRLRSITAAI